VGGGSEGSAGDVDQNSANKAGGSGESHSSLSPGVLGAIAASVLLLAVIVALVAYKYKQMRAEKLQWGTRAGAFEMGGLGGDDMEGRRSSSVYVDKIYGNYPPASSPAPALAPRNSVSPPLRPMSQKERLSRGSFAGFNPHGPAAGAGRKPSVMNSPSGGGSADGSLPRRSLAPGHALKNASVKTATYL
jgi:hypothetical protein